jgi:hypothetical protein
MPDALRLKKGNAYIKYVLNVTTAKLQLRFGTRTSISPKERRNEQERQQQLVE